MSISRDEWLAALGDAVTPCDPDALTIQELAQQFKISPMTAYRRMRVLLRDGKAVATFKTIATSAGHGKRVPAYRLVTPTKGKRAA